MLAIQQEKKVHTYLNYWKRYLLIEEWTIDTEAISLWQVSDDFCCTGHQFVGVSRDTTYKQATIHHTRSLTEEDIVHELLHLRYPKWSEEKVVKYTDLLLKNKGEINEIL